MWCLFSSCWELLFYWCQGGLEERLKSLEELLGVAYQISCHPITDCSLLRDQVGPEVGRSKTKHKERARKDLCLGDVYVIDWHGKKDEMRPGKSQDFWAVFDYLLNSSFSISLILQRDKCAIFCSCDIMICLEMENHRNASVQQLINFATTLNSSWKGWMHLWWLKYQH